jgi:heterotetrameric sarcosine oxidase gamma subunit
MSLEFLTPASGAAAGETPVARSPMERSAKGPGATFRAQDGWNVATSYGSSEREADLCASTVGWADVSHLGKLELQASPEAMASIVAAATAGATLELGSATRVAGAWWLPLTASRTLVVCDASDANGLQQRLVESADGRADHVSVADVSSVFAAMRLVGPMAREVFARFCALDLRPAVTPVAALRPGSIARQPGLIVREDEDRFLFLFGWAVGEYMWTVVEDAARHLGGGPIGLDALAAITHPSQEGARA